MEHLLNKLNTTMEKVLDKLDDQSQKISELSVKVDLYREVQNDHGRKLDNVDKIASDAMASTKAAHKRLDDIENDVKDAMSEVSSVSKEAAAATGVNNEHEKRIAKLEKVVYWVGTTVIGALLTGSIGVLVFSNLTK